MVFGCSVKTSAEEPRDPKHECSLELGVGVIGEILLGADVYSKKCLDHDMDWFRA